MIASITALRGYKSMSVLSVNEFGDGELVVDSRLIAMRLGIQHESLMRTIYKYKAKLEERFGSLRFQIGVKEKNRGGEQPLYVLLNEPQATTLMTLSRNTEEVVDCKFELVEAFETAKLLLQQRRRRVFNRRLQDATLQVYTLEDPVRWAERGKVFQDNFYNAIYQLKGKSRPDKRNQHPIWMANVTIDLVYRRLQPGLWDELCSKNPKVNGRRKFCCHQFLSDNISNPHLKNHLYAITKMMNGYSSWREFKYNLDKCYPKTDVVQMDVLFDLFSQSPEDYDKWHGLVS